MRHFCPESLPSLSCRNACAPHEQTLAWVTKSVGYSAGAVDSVVKKVCPIQMAILVFACAQFGSRVENSMAIGQVLCCEGRRIFPLSDHKALSIFLVCVQVLSQRRVQRQAAKPLTHTEFVPHLAKIDPLFKDDFEKFAVSPPAHPLARPSYTPFLGSSSTASFPARSSCHTATVSFVPYTLTD